MEKKRLVGLVVNLLLMVFCLQGSVFAESNIDIFTENILNYFKDSNYEILYEKMSTEAKSAMPYDGMVGFFKLEKEVLGALKQYNKLESLKQVVGNKPVITLRYTAHFENTNAIITLVIVEENGQLACKTLHVDSLIFMKPEVQKRFEEFSPK